LEFGTLIIGIWYHCLYFLQLP